MNREEHLAWCKERALKYVDHQDYKNAIASMCSDLRKHPETENHSGAQIGLLLAISGHLNTEHQVRNWIVGFH